MALQYYFGYNTAYVQALYHSFLRREHCALPIVALGHVCTDGNKQHGTHNELNREER